MELCMSSSDQAPFTFSLSLAKEKPKQQGNEEKRPTQIGERKKRLIERELDNL